MNFLVIGYGNSLRTDDGAGQIVAQMITQWQLTGVQCLAVQQLTPELAENIANADVVIFVDAVATDSDNPTPVQVQPLPVEAINSSLGHHCNPRSLLAYAQILYGKVVKAYWVLIPGINFDFGETFSTVTQQGIDIALNQIKQILLTKA